MSKALRWGLLGLIAVAAAVAVQQWNQPHRDYGAEAAAQRLEASDLHVAFFDDPTAAAGAFANQVVEVTGIVAAVDAQAVVFEPGVVCRWEKQQSALNWQAGEVHTAKIRVLSFDDLLGEVSCDHGVPVKE